MRCDQAPLTFRERRALSLTLDAAGTKAIAAELGVSEVTAWTIVHATLSRLGFR